MPVRYPSYSLHHLSDFSPGIDLSTAISLGRVNGYTALRTWGRALLEEGLEVMLWGAGGPYLPLSTPQALSIVSTSADDKLGEAGANRLIVEGYDADFEYIAESIAMNGTTPVVTENEYLRVTNLSITVAGDGNSNEIASGKITATAVGREYAAILAGEKSSWAAYIILPPKKAVLIHAVHIGVSNASGSLSTISLKVKNPYSSLPVSLWEHQTDTSCSLQFKTPITIQSGGSSNPWLTDIYFTAKTSSTGITSASHASVVAEYTLVDQLT
jgi:hypothetical protein